MIEVVAALVCLATARWLWRRHRTMQHALATLDEASQRVADARHTGDDAAVDFYSQRARDAQITVDRLKF